MTNKTIDIPADILDKLREKANDEYNISANFTFIIHDFIHQYLDGKIKIEGLEHLKSK